MGGLSCRARDLAACARTALDRTAPDRTARNRAPFRALSFAGYRVSRILGVERIDLALARAGRRASRDDVPPSERRPRARHRGVAVAIAVAARSSRFRGSVASRKWLLAIPPLVFAAVYFGFHADNPYNTAFPDFYLHNGLVQAISGQAGWRALAAVVATLAAAGLALTRLTPAAAFWLYPISAFALAAEWLVETRYLIVPFALWLAFREQRSKAVEYATLALWPALAVLIIAGMLGGRIFLVALQLLIH